MAATTQTRISPKALRTAEAKHFKAADGARLFYRYWPSASPSDRALVLLHRGHELDYVYRNRPSGITPAGKLIDWFYVNSVGWRGIRVRKENIETMLGEAI